MAADSSELTIVVRARDQASAIIEKVQQQVGERFTGSMQRAQQGSMLLATGVLAAGAATAGLGTVAIRSAGEYEQSRVAFETMLGSADKARKMMSDIAEFAKSTPFELPQVVQASKQLLAFGFSQDQIIPTMRRLGDIASGVGVPVGQLAYVFGQVRVAGKLMGGDLMQFTNAGVPMIEELSKVLGVSQSEVKKLVEQGKVGFPEVEKAIMNLTGEGSRFGGMMDKQSKTLDGVISNIKDGFGQTLRTMVGITAAGDIIEGGLFDKIKGAAERLMPVVQNLPQTLANGFKMIQPYIPAIAGAILLGLVPAFYAWASATWAAISPLLPFLAIGAALGALIKFVVDKMGGWSAAWGKLKGAISPVVNIIVGVLKPAFEALWNTIQTVLWPALQRLWNFLGPILKPVLIGLAALIIGPIVAAIGLFVGAIWLITNALNIAIQVAQWLFNNVIVPGINIAVTVFQFLWAVVTTVFNAIATVVSTVVNVIVGVFMVFFNIYSFIFQTIFAIAMWAWNGIYNAAIKPVIDRIVGGINWLGGVVTGVWNWILNIARPIFNAVGSAAVGVWNWIVGVWHGAVGFFSGIFNGIRNVANSIIGGLGGIFSGAWNGLKDGFKGAVNFVVDLANKLISGYNNTVGRIPGTPKIGNLPRFAKGVEGFEGGFAITGERGPELAYWPRGTNIMSNDDLKEALGGAGGGKSVNNNFYGEIKLESEGAVDRFFQRLNDNAELASMGVATV